MRRLFTNNPKPRTPFLALFATVFLLVLGSCAVFAFFASDEYASSAVIKLEPATSTGTLENDRGQASGNYDFIRQEIKLIRSESVLRAAAKNVLITEFRRNAAPDAAKVSEADLISLLKQKVELRPVPNTTLIEVRAFGENPWLTCDVANDLARTYLESRRRNIVEGMSSLQMVEMVETAVPGSKPARPNRALILALGILGGALLGLAVAGAGTLLTSRGRSIA